MTCTKCPLIMLLANVGQVGGVVKRLFGARGIESSCCRVSSAKGLSQLHMIITASTAPFFLPHAMFPVCTLQEHVSNVLDSGKALDRVVFQEIHSGEIFGFDSFLTGAPAYSSIVVDSEKAVVSLEYYLLSYLGRAQVCRY